MENREHIKNILYICHYAGSPEMGMAFRPYYLAREWVKTGHDVTIVAADYSHLRKHNPEITEDLQEEMIDGIRYVWVKTGRYSSNGVARAKTMFTFVKKLRNSADRLIEKYSPDVLITSSTYPLDTYAGQKIRKAGGGRPKLIHEVHDMWPLTLYELGGMSKYNPFAVLMQISENSFCRNADRVCSLLPYAKDYFIKHGMRPDKFFSIANGVVEEEWTGRSELPEEAKALFNTLRKDGKFIIGFFGSHTRAYNLDYLIEAAAECGEKVSAVFVGDGNYKEELIKLAAEKGADAYFLDHIPKTSIPALLRNIDASYVSAVDNSMFRFGICMNKLFDAMMGGKPVLYAVNAPNNYILDYDCGISVAPADKDALIRGIKELVAMSDEERERLGQNGKTAILNDFTYNKLAQKFLEEIEGKTV